MGWYKVRMGHTATKQTVPWEARVLTLFPQVFPGVLGVSCVGRAAQRGLWRLSVVDLRAYAVGRAVDAPPYGGGPGMVLRADVVAAAVDAVHPHTDPLVCLTPAGTPLTQQRVEELACGAGVTVVCGRFEGVDQRVLDARRAEEISVGDFVCAGGEGGAMLLLEAAVRVVPGVVGRGESLRHESFADGLLEYPHYTRPKVWEGHAVPEVLLSGDHSRIAAWRRAQAAKLTENRRPDLWKKFLSNS